MNDNQLRGPQFRELVADYFIPLFGKTRDEWKKANYDYSMEEFKEFSKTLKSNPEIDAKEYYDNFYPNWVNKMLNSLNLPLLNENEARILAKKALFWITKRIDSTYEGVVDTIIHLKNKYPLALASNSDTMTLKGYLTGMGVTNCFIKLHGADIYGKFKSSPRFYQNILNELSIEASKVIVIDDSPEFLRNAEKIGLTPIQSMLPNSFDVEFKNHIYNFRELIDLIPSL